MDVLHQTDTPCNANCFALQSGQLTPIDLIVEEHFHRAAPGGMGGTKAAGNYSPVLVTQLEAKRNNYAGGGTRCQAVTRAV